MIESKHVYWMILALKLVQNVLDEILDYFFGFKTATGWKKDRERAMYDYGTSAQIVTIITRGAYTPVWEHGPNNYVYFHEQYLHPNFVLKHDNISLKACTPTHAIFAVTEPGVNVYDLNKYPFVMVAQYYNAIKLVFIPLWACVKLGEEMGDLDPNINIISISNSARSGSTLLAKMFYNLPETLAMNEPWALYHLHRWYNSSKIRERDYPKFVQGLFKLQVKPFNKMNIRIIAFKGAGQMTPMHKLLNKFFPQLKIIFNSRHPKETMISYIHTLQAPEMEPMLRYQYHDLFMPSLPFDYDSDELQNLQTKLIRESHITSISKSCAYSYGSKVDFYLRHKDLYRWCVLYEDLVTDTKNEVRKLFRALDLSEDFVPDALDAMKTHSQGKFFGDPLKDKRKKELDDKDFEEINEAFKDMQVPLNTNMSLESFRKLF